MKRVQSAGALLAAKCACSQLKALTVSGGVSFFASHVSMTSRSYVWPSAATRYLLLSATLGHCVRIETSTEQQQLHHSAQSGCWRYSCEWMRAHRKQQDRASAPA